MSSALQSFFIWFFRPISQRMEKISDKTRNTVITLSFFMIGMLFVVQRTFTAYIRQAYSFLYLCVFLIIIIIFSLKNPLQKVCWNKWLTIPWFLCTFCILLAGIVTTMDYLPMGVLFLVGLPCFLLVWGNRKDYHVLYSCWAGGTLLTMGVVILACILFAPLRLGLSYHGICINPNGFGQICCMGLIAALYGFEKWKGFKKWISLFMAGVSVVFIIFSLSRTSALSMILIFAVWLLYAVVSVIRNGVWKKKLWQTGQVLLSIAVALLLFYGLLTTVNRAIGMKIADVVNIIQMKLAPETEEYIDSQGEGVEEGTLITIFESFGHRIGTSETGLLAYSSGRMAIWDSYRRELNILGHTSEHSFEIPGRGQNSTAHNGFLQLAYDCGIPAGILYLVFCAIVGILSILYAFKAKEMDFAHFMPLVITIGYGMIIMMESVQNPITSWNSFTFLLMLPAVFSFFNTRKKTETPALKDTQTAVAE